MTLPMLAPGFYYAVAVVDDTTAGTNNRQFTRFEVAAPDVTIGSLTVTPSTVSPGQNASAAVQIVHRGLPSYPTTADVFLATPLCARMDETVPPPEITDEGETG